MKTDALGLLDDATRMLRGFVGSRRPRVGIVLGSGLDDVIGAASDIVEIPYAEIPGFVSSSVQGHAGSLVFATIAGVETAIMRGRVHLYEGHHPLSVVHPVRTLVRLGIEVLVLTNAAGGLVPELRTGDIMCISDHLNLTGANPLVGPNLDALGPRFPVMAAAYDEELRAVARSVAHGAGIRLAEGVYAGVLGPTFETPAEVEALVRLGAHAAGMSTVFETIAARHAGVRVVGFSLITNAAGSAHGHEDVLAAGREGAANMATLVTGVVSALDAST